MSGDGANGDLWCAMRAALADRGRGGPALSVSVRWVPSHRPGPGPDLAAVDWAGNRHADQLAAEAYVRGAMILDPPSTLYGGDGTEPFLGCFVTGTDSAKMS